MSAFLPVAMGLYKKLDEAIELCLSSTGKELSKENKKEFIAEMLLEQSQYWNLQLDGSNLLDDETKFDALRLLAGIAINLGENDHARYT